MYNRSRSNKSRNVTSRDSLLELWSLRDKREKHIRTRIGSNNHFDLYRHDRLQVGSFLVIEPHNPPAPSTHERTSRHWGMLLIFHDFGTLSVSSTTQVRGSRSIPFSRNTDVKNLEAADLTEIPSLKACEGFPLAEECTAASVSNP
jgi:hypothetical protein